MESLNEIEKSSFDRTELSFYFIILKSSSQPLLLFLLGVESLLGVFVLVLLSKLPVVLVLRLLFNSFGYNLNNVLVIKSVAQTTALR
jgi:hypothetical protein